LNDGLFQVHLASSFLNGYRSERDFPRGMLGPSLKMLWYLESEWWIRLDLEIHKEIPPARFAQEMIWLAEHDLKITPMLEHL
jgi:homoserine kinase type II